MTHVRGLLLSALAICAPLVAWNPLPAEGACDSDDHLLWKTEMRWPESIQSTSGLATDGDVEVVDVADSRNGELVGVVPGLHDVGVVLQLASGGDR